MEQIGSEIGNTHFAITSVNVPDRLDMRDMDDRKQAEEDYRKRRIDPAVLRAWLPRMFFLALVVGAALALFEAIETWSTTLSASQLSQRLSRALGVPVRIETSQFSISPTPRLVLSKVVVDNQLVLPEISVNLATKTVSQMFQARGWAWGEAVVAPTVISLEQGRSLIALTSKLDGAFPKSLSTVRFEHLEVAGQPWLSGSWAVSLARGKDGAFATVTATQQTEKNSLRFDLTPAANPGEVAVQMEAKNRSLPFLPNFPLEIAVASGHLTADRVEVDQFSLGGVFGSIQGRLSGTLSGVWLLEGFAQTDGVDLEALFHDIAPPPPPRDDDPNGAALSAFQGTAAFSGHFEGVGKTLFEAGESAIFQAPVHVRWPILNGVNLGYAATRPGETGGTGGGTTRFSALDGQLLANATGVTLRDIHARAGALLASGEVRMGAGHELSGLLHVDMGATRVLAPIRVVVRGTLQRPEFGR